MMCYRDRTFCVAPCATADCHKKLTDEVLEGAKAWMGDDAPIAVDDFRDECADYIAEDK